MDLQPITQNNESDSSFPSLQEHHRRRKCSIIKAVVSIGSLAVLTTAGVAGYGLAQQLHAPVAVQSVMIMGEMPMPTMPPKPVKKCGNQQAAEDAEF